MKVNLSHKLLLLQIRINTLKGKAPECSYLEITDNGFIKEVKH
jgi:hypothetical protein